MPSVVAVNDDRPPGLTAMFAASYATRPDKLAVRDDQARLSWGELERRVSVLADHLGSGSGPVGLDNLPATHTLVALLAASLSRRPVVLLPRDWTSREREEGLARTHVTTLITRNGVRQGHSAIPPIGLFASGDPTDLSLIGFTSGTSGRPKVFARTESSWSSSFDPAAKLFRLDSDENVFIPGDLTHTHFLYGALLGLHAAATVELMEGFDPELLRSRLQGSEQATLYLVPTMIIALDRHGSGSLPMARTVIVSGAKMQQHHWAAARRQFPDADIYELYGSSETSFISVSHNPPGLPVDLLSVGRPFPGVDVRIRPYPDLRTDEGDVLVRSPYLFSGYLHSGRLSRPISRDGFVTVGDIGALSADGRLELRGRATNMLITGAKNVHPEEVEAHLSCHPQISDCVVIGVPHEYWGDELVACIVVRDEAVIDVRDFLLGRVARHKIPKRTIVLDRLPTTPLGKVDRRKVLEIARDHLR